MIMQRVKELYNNAETEIINVSDGGEGLTNILGAKFQTIETETVDSLFKKIHAKFSFDKQGKTAIIESAAACGLNLIDESERNPLITTSYGVGLMVNEAIRRGATKIILGIGGTSVNDCYCGGAAASGYEFYNADKQKFIPTGGTLHQIENILSPKEIPDIEITAACDVENFLYGINGAAYVYALQKGADKKDLPILDNGLRHFVEVAHKKINIDIHNLRGGGAGGGIAAGVKVFFDAKLKSGADIVLDYQDFDNKINDADLIITGEGSFDNQSFQGKITGNIISRSKQKGKKVIVICGISDIENSNVIRLFNKKINQEEAIRETPERIKKLIIKF